MTSALLQVGEMAKAFNALSLSDPMQACRGLTVLRGFGDGGYSTKNLFVLLDGSGTTSAPWALGATDFIVFVWRTRASAFILDMFWISSLNMPG